MSKPIIVGYDPMTSDRAPIHFGLAAARFTGAPLIIASASAAGDRPDAGQQDEDLVLDASEALEQARRELEPEGIPVECRELANTSAARALHEMSEAENAGLLVVGSTRRGPVGRVIPGSTAERLMHGAPCPIAIVPPGWEAGAGLNTIGVAYVDTDEGREALRGAHALARRAGATLRVLTAVKAGLAMYGKTEARTAERRGKTSTRSKGNSGSESRAHWGGRPRRSTVTLRSRLTPSSRIPRTSSSASRRTSTCSSAGRARSASKPEEHAVVARELVEQFHRRRRPLRRGVSAGPQWAVFSIPSETPRRHARWHVYRPGEDRSSSARGART